MGQTLTKGGNHIESPSNLAATPATLCCRPLSRPRGLQQNSLCSARMQNHCTPETRYPTHMGAPRTTWILAGPRHASLPLSKCIHLFHGHERIVDTLEFFPHNYQMPQLSSADLFIMAANDMTDALQNPHTDVPFAQIGDDTVLALAELAAIFKIRLRQTPAATLPTAPLKVIQRPCLTESSDPLLASPMPPPRQTRSHTTIHTQDMTNAPLPPRVVTPSTLRPSPPRVPTRSR
jgi:hypothetical protein